MLAQDEGLERTEQPTERRREEAREQGQFAYSHELVNSLVMLAGALAVTWSSHVLVDGLRAGLQEHLRALPVEMNAHEASELLTLVSVRGLEMVGGVCAGMFAVGLGANLAQAGVRVTPDALGPKWEKLNPVTGWQRLWSLAGVARGMWAIVRVIVIAAVVWWVLRGTAGRIALLSDGTLGQSVRSAWELTSRVLVTVAASLVTIGAGDYAVQWFRHEKSLMMTRQELKDEHKEEEGDPLLRNLRRQRAREIASQRRMITEVPKATVVITNPTHFAVALRYERGVTSAPIVVAKGRDSFALQIATKARRHGIPVIERKPLARTLYKVAKVGQEIPQSLYLAVSEVLAFVYRLRGTAA
jgi:flagellar biosynthetic protein FlhB